VLLNVEGYFTPLLAMIDHGIEQRFIKPSVRELFFVAESVAEAMEHFRLYHPPAVADKWGKDVPSAAE
jgi:predicted Rossmann-fold nucleotide-binding protein